MKKLLLIPLALAVLLTGCAGRGDKNPEESAAAAHQVAPLTLSEEESALLDLIAGTDGEYGLYACGMGEDMTGCTIEVLSWEDGAWQTLAEGGLSSSSSETLRPVLQLVGDPAAGHRAQRQQDHRQFPGRRLEVQLRPPGGGHGPGSELRPELGVDGRPPGAGGR